MISNQRSVLGLRVRCLACPTSYPFPLGCQLTPETVTFLPWFSHPKFVWFELAVLLLTMRIVQDAC